MKRLVLSSLRHYRGLHLLVAGGVSVAVAVLAGALLVGSSVRASLRELALARLGATDIIVSSTGFFREQLAEDLRQRGIGETTPLLALTGSVTHEESRRTAARVNVFGIDDRFLALHGRERGVPIDRNAWISTALADELGVETSDGLLLRVAKPTDIPLSNLQGRREEVSERVRLSVERVVDRAGLGEFSLQRAQGPAFSIFVPLSRLQQDLDLRGHVNALLVRMPVSAEESNDLAETQVASVRQALNTSARLDDIGLGVRTNSAGTLWILEGRTGLLPETLWRQAAQTAGGPSVGALTYLANSIRAGGRSIPYSLIAAMDIEAYDRLGGQGEDREIREKNSTGLAGPTVGRAPPQSISPAPPIW
jgi:putative ABC transport system permease protein